MTPLLGFVYGIIGGGAAFAATFFRDLVADEFEWERSRRRTWVAVILYIVRALLYTALGGVAGWTTVIFGDGYAAVVGGIAGPAVLLSFTATSQPDGQKNNRSRDPVDGGLDGGDTPTQGGDTGA
jgi:hypothetical protein